MVYHKKSGVFWPPLNAYSQKEFVITHASQRDVWETITQGWKYVEPLNTNVVLTSAFYLSTVVPKYFLWDLCLSKTCYIFIALY